MSWSQRSWLNRKGAFQNGKLMCAKAEWEKAKSMFRNQEIHFGWKGDLELKNNGESLGIH